MEIKDREGILEAITATLHETFGIDKARLVPGADLYQDLGIDSIDAIDLMVKLQKMIGKRLQPEDFKSVRTIDDVAAAIEKLVTN